MPNAELICEVSAALKSSYGRVRSIRSAYIYGSILTDQFSSNSDIDVLFIVDALPQPSTFLRMVKQRRVSVNGHALDINVVFAEEFLQRWHIYRPPSYFYWIRRRGQLIWGEDQIKEIQSSEVTAKSVYKRAVDLAQSCRSVYVNDKDGTFWQAKYRRWIRTLVCEINFLDDTLDYDFDRCARRLMCVQPALKSIRALNKENLRWKSSLRQRSV